MRPRASACALLPITSKSASDRRASSSSASFTGPNGDSDRSLAADGLLELLLSENGLFRRLANESPFVRTFTLQNEVESFELRPSYVTA
jgi:hypothetical protein